MNKFTPTGWHTITPRIVVDDPAEMVKFLKAAFNALGDYEEDRPAVMTIGDSKIMVSGVGPREPMPAFLYLYVANTDATYKLALKAGAVSLEPPADMPYGDRRAMIKDPFGNDWQIATHGGTR
jgi:uncharacterized glyoxalase superfamily protein PhnB